MKIEDINETVFQALTPEVQQTLIEASQTPTPVVIVGMVIIAIIILFLGMVLID